MAGNLREKNIGDVIEHVGRVTRMVIRNQSESDARIAKLEGNLKALHRANIEQGSELRGLRRELYAQFEELKKHNKILW